MKYKEPQVAAMFFMTNFNRDRGDMVPLDPPDPQLISNRTLFISSISRRGQYHKKMAAKWGITYNILFICPSPSPKFMNLLLYR